MKLTALALIVSAALAACAPAVASDRMAAPAAATPSTATVTLNMDLGARTGRVMVALYDAQAAYDGGAPVRQALVDASSQTAAVFEGLPQGEYAAKMFHDVNGNGTMDTNPFGMPIEPYAFSNNAVGNMGPAGWDRARFSVTGDTQQTIRLR